MQQPQDRNYNDHANFDSDNNFSLLDKTIVLVSKKVLNAYKNQRPKQSLSQYKVVPLIPHIVSYKYPWLLKAYYRGTCEFFERV